MEMLIIGLIAIASFAAVLLPLLRRGRRVANDEEFDGPAQALTEPTPAADAGSPVVSDAIEAEIVRYRAAVRAGTVCGKCGQANPDASRYCYECGGRLPLADAREYE